MLKRDDCSCHPYADAIQNGDELECVCLEGFALTSTNECVSCDDLTGVTENNAASCKCVNNAFVDGYGVCVCDNGYLETTEGTCMDKTNIFGITVNANCGIGTILWANGECVCQDNHIPTANNDRCISIDLLTGHVDDETGLCIENAQPNNNGICNCVQDYFWNGQTCTPVNIDSSTTIDSTTTSSIDITTTVIAVTTTNPSQTTDKINTDPITDTIAPLTVEITTRTADKEDAGDHLTSTVDPVTVDEVSTSGLITVHDATTPRDTEDVTTSIINDVTADDLISRATDTYQVVTDNINTSTTSPATNRIVTTNSVTHDEFITRTNASITDDVTTTTIGRLTVDITTSTTAPMTNEDTTSTTGTITDNEPISTTEQIANDVTSTTALKPDDDDKSTTAIITHDQGCSRGQRFFSIILPKDAPC